MKGLGINVCCSSNSLGPVMEARGARRHVTSPRLYPVLWCRAALGQMESTLPLSEVLELRWERPPAPSAQSKLTWGWVPGTCSPPASPSAPAGTRTARHLGCQGFWSCGWLRLMAGPVAPVPGRAQGGDQVSSSTMNYTPLCIRMSPTTVQLLPFSRHGGQQLALLSALTGHSGTGGRCSVPEVAGGVALPDWPASSS